MEKTLSKIITYAADDIYHFILAIICPIPGRSGIIIRNVVFRLLGSKIGRKSRLREGIYVKGLKNISIGEDTGIMQYGKLIATESFIKIGSKCSFNMNVNINAGPGGEIVIGNYVLIGPNTVIRASNHSFNRFDIPIREQGHVAGTIIIGDDVWIGANCVILPNVKIGSHAIIAAGAVVNKDVAEYEVAGGVPARKIYSRTEK